MKRSRTFLALALMVPLILAACGPVNTQEPEAGPGAPAVQEPAQMPEEGGQTPAAERLGFRGGNIGTGGLMAEDGAGWVYYRSEADNWYLYKARLDGSEKTRLTEDCPACLNVLDGWVYYTNYFDGFSLYRVRTDGTGRERLVEGYCDNLYAADSGLYFDRRDETNGSHVYRCGLDGGNLRELLPGYRVSCYYDGVVYVSDTQRLAAYDIESGTLETVAEEYTHNVTVDDTGVYYWAADEYVYYRLAPGGEPEALLTGGDYFNYTDGSLYYFGYGGEDRGCFCCYRLDAETGETETLLELSGEYFDDAGNLTGITLSQSESVDIDSLDERFFDEQGQFLGFGYVESFTYPVVVGEQVMARGCLRQSLVENGRLDCWILMDGAGGRVWD